MAGIRKRCATLLRSSGLPDAELSVLFIGDRAMRSLNRAWRGKDKTTDVLSFPFKEKTSPQVRSRGCKAISGGMPPPHMLGDIVISAPAARRQARAAGHGFSRELDLLLVHGFVHLLGYDHERGAREARSMAKKEQQLLKRLG